MANDMINGETRDISFELYDWLCAEFESAFYEHFHYSYALELLEICKRESSLYNSV